MADHDRIPALLSAGREITDPDEAEALGLTVEARRLREAAKPFRPTMELGFDDCDPVATCHCGARCKGDSINDALTAWGKHLTTVHKGEW